MSSYVLLESGFGVLLESGSHVLLESTQPSESLGRFRLGDTVLLGFASPSVPVSAPSATITGPSPSSATVATVPLWTRDGGLTFQAPVLLGPSFSVGTYSVVATLALVSGNIQYSEQFDLVAGGDPAGSIIAMYEHEGVSGRSVVVQTAAGRLLAGRDPWV